MTYGEILRQIRVGKGMKLKEAAGDTLSLSQLSRFENGLSMIPIDSFNQVLTNINTTPHEFLYLLGDPQEKELSQFFNEVERLVNSRQYDKLKALKNELKKQKPAPYHWQRFMLLFVESLLELSENKRAKNQPEVLDYLMQVDDWGEMELRIYAIFSFVFDVETTYHLMKTAIKKSQKYQALPQDMKLLFTILMNTFSTFIYHQRFDYAEETLQIFEKQLEKDVALLDPHLDLLFNKGVLAFSQNRLEEAKAHCEQAIELCRLFKQTSMEERYRYRYENWLENYQKSDYKELTINIGWVE